jgi:hypothetical protein
MTLAYELVRMIPPEQTIISVPPNASMDCISTCFSSMDRLLDHVLSYVPREYLADLNHVHGSVKSSEIVEFSFLVHIKVWHSNGQNNLTET